MSMLLLKSLIAGAVLFYMFLFWLARPKRIEIPLFPTRSGPCMIYSVDAWGKVTCDSIDGAVYVDPNPR